MLTATHPNGDRTPQISKRLSELSKPSARGGATELPVTVQRVIGDDGREKLEVIHSVNSATAGIAVTRTQYDPANISQWALLVFTKSSVAGDSPLVWARLRAAEELIRPKPRADVLEECQALIADLWDCDRLDTVTMLLRRFERTLAMLSGFAHNSARSSSKADARDYVAKTREALEVFKGKLGEVTA